VPQQLGRVLNTYFAQQQQQAQLDLQLQVQVELDQQKAEQQRLFNLLRAALDMSEEELRAALKSRKADQRFVAAYAVGERRLFWIDDLTGLLKDPSDAVRQAARRSHVILSFLHLNPEVALARPGQSVTTAVSLTKAKDFGPPPGAKPAARAKAAEDWTQWWSEQGRTDLKTLDTRDRAVEADQLADKLVKAAQEQQKKLLKKYAATLGVEYTEAIAHAIPRLNGEARKEARQTLADRLSDRSEATLLRYLVDSDSEIRRAAVLALAMRDAKDAVTAVAPLILDPNPSVVRATCASLRTLTGEDYGPLPNATEEEKQEAVKRYREWTFQK